MSNTYVLIIGGGKFGQMAVDSLQKSHHCIVIDTNSECEVARNVSSLSSQEEVQEFLLDQPQFDDSKHSLLVCVGDSMFTLMCIQTRVPAWIIPTAVPTAAERLPPGSGPMVDTKSSISPRRVGVSPRISSEWSGSPAATRPRSSPSSEWSTHIPIAVRIRSPVATEAWVE